MKAVIQRVKESRVTVKGQTVGEIKKGILVLLGIAKDDTESDVNYLLEKIPYLRIFEDMDGKMNLSLLDTGGEILVVSQFTLLGDCKKGRRPSYAYAAKPDHARFLYTLFVERLKEKGLTPQTGEFQAMMDVSLVNDGPVTLIVESR